MNSLRLVGFGTLLVLLDFRLNSVDLIPDLVGWAMCLAGLLKLSRTTWFVIAQLGCLIGLAGAAAELLNPPDGWIVQTASSLSSSALIIGVCAGLMKFLSDERHRTTARGIIAGWVATEVAGLLLAAAFRNDSSGSEPLVVILVIAGLAVAIWFVVFMLRLDHVTEGGVAV